MNETMDEFENRMAEYFAENAERVVEDEDSEVDAAFDYAYGPAKVEVRDGEFWLVDGGEEFETGVTVEDVEEHGLADVSEVETLSDLASATNRNPSDLACDEGWDCYPVTVVEIASKCEVTAKAIADAKQEAAEQEHERREEAKAAAEEDELYEKEMAEQIAMDRGEEIEYCDAETLEEAAAEIGMPSDSQTARKYFEGKLHRGEALRRARKISWRHEQSDYESLLDAGYLKEDAREQMRQI